MEASRHDGGVPADAPSGAPADAPGMTLVHLLRGITVELDLFGAEFARRNHLHPTDLRALIHLLDATRAGMPASPGWLAEHLRLDSSSVTALLDRLEHRGYVERRPDPGDRRRVLVTVQPEAQALGWSFFGPLITDVVTAVASFDGAELATVDRFLRTVTEVVLASRHGRAEAT